MLQLQYYNAKLTKKHIDNILNNFNIKYTTIKNEIDAKLNSLLKIFMEDILSFLENIEEITKERKKIKEFESIKREYDILNLKYKEKALNERKLESNIESLQKEITFLKNEKQAAKKQKYNLAESKTPTSHKNKNFRGIFSKKKDLKNQTDSLNTTCDNIAFSSSKNNVFFNPINKSSKKVVAVNKANIINSKLSQIKEISNRRKKKESIMIKNEKSYNSRSPDIALVKKKTKIDSKGNFDKTIQKIKQYNTNRNNLKIQKLQKSKFGIKKNKNKVNGNSNAFIVGYNKRTKYLNKKVKEKEKEEDNKNKTYEGVEQFLALIESPVNNNVTTKNYSEDDDNHSKKNNNNGESFCSSSISSDSSDSERFDEEIKELEEDENNILNIIKEIKELKN